MRFLARHRDSCNFIIINALGNDVISRKLRKDHGDVEVLMV